MKRAPLLAGGPVSESSMQAAPLSSSITSPSSHQCNICLVTPIMRHHHVVVLMYDPSDECNVQE